MSVLEPGQIRRMQAARRREVELEEMRHDLLASQQALVASAQRERALRAELQRMELTLIAKDADGELERAVLDIADRDRDLRILRRQLAAAKAALQTYAKQDERRKTPRSVAAETLRLLNEAIPREEGYDAPRQGGRR